MYRHTTPTPLKYFLENDFSGEMASKIPLAHLEVEVERIWGDYHGTRTGAGRYVDLYADGVPAGRLWATDQTVGLLHVPAELDINNRRESEIAQWNAAADIRRSFHLKLSASAAFDLVVNKHDPAPVLETDELESINFPEVDAVFYQGRYDPSDEHVWCEEMK